MAGKWVTIGKGSDSRPIIVGEPVNKKVTSPGLFDMPETTALPENYQKVIETLGALFNRLDDDMQDQLEVKEYFVSLEPTFDDPDAYDQLQFMIRHVFQRLVALEAHLRNLNRNGVKNGVDLSYLYNTFASIGRQSTELTNLYKELPQYNTRLGRDAVASQDRLTASVNRSAGTIMSLMQQDYNIPQRKGKDRSKTDWDHLRKGSLKRYINRSRTVNIPP